MKKIPPLPQKYFVLLWKTLYALFMEPDLSAPSTEEQQVGQGEHVNLIFKQ